MNQAKDRLFALDAFRGITIALMIIVNNPGAWSHVYGPLRHAQWHGCTLTDLVFPFFLFIMGISMSFSFDKYDLCKTGPLFNKIIFRTISIFSLGLIINAFPFIRQDWDWSSFRILGVLQRISLAYFIAAFIILRTNIKGLVQISFITLAGYWLLLYSYGLINSVDPYALSSNLILAIDTIIIGENHLYGGTGIQFDPEGLLSTIPCAITVILGFLVGTMIKTAKDHKENSQRMLILGSFLIIIGWVWGIFFPINKQLWTSSYVLYTAGIGTVILSIMIWLIDILGYKKWTFPFVVFGSNSIFIFALSGIWTKILLKIRFELNGDELSGYSYLYQTIFVPMAGAINGSLLFAVFHVFSYWIILLWMHKKKIFIKL